MITEDLIPCTPELNRLKIFLTTIPAEDFEKEKDFQEALNELRDFYDQKRAIAAMNKRHQEWIDLLKGGPFPKV